MFDATNANCATADPELFFPEGPRSAVTNSTAYAKAICVTCPVKLACLQEALANDYDGIWGGTTTSERRSMRSKRVVLSPRKSR